MATNVVKSFTVNFLTRWIHVLSDINCTCSVCFAVFTRTFLYLLAHIGIFIEIKIYQMVSVRIAGEHVKQTHRNKFFFTNILEFF